MPFDPAEIGFEFSTEEIAAREQQIRSESRHPERPLLRIQEKRLPQAPRQSRLKDG